MAFPLPLDPEFKRQIVRDWINDVSDRLEGNYTDDAEQSWKIASEIYLSLPPGEGSEELEADLVAARVKLNQIHTA